MIDRTATLLAMTCIIAGDNDRTSFSEEALRDLAEQIRVSGLLQPITVRRLQDGRYQIIAGERRFRACTTILKWIDIPAQIIAATDEEAAKLMLAENVSRQDLDPIDEAHAYAKRMERFNWTVEECAHFAGVTQVRVQFRLKLLKLLPEMQQLIRCGHLQLGYAQVLADAKLTPGFQSLALGRLRDNPQPTPPWFRRIVEELAEQQNQGALFDSPLFDGQCPEQIAGATPLPPDPAKDKAVVTGHSLKERIGEQIAFWTDAAEAWNHLGKPFKRQECAAAVRILQDTLD